MWESGAWYDAATLLGGWWRSASGMWVVWRRGSWWGGRRLRCGWEHGFSWGNAGIGQEKGVGEYIDDISCPWPPAWGAGCCRQALKSNDALIKCVIKRMMTLRPSGERDSGGCSASKPATDPSSRCSASIRCGSAPWRGKRGPTAGGMADGL